MAIISLKPQPGELAASGHFWSKQWSGFLRRSKVLLLSNSNSSSKGVCWKTEGQWPAPDPLQQRKLSLWMSTGIVRWNGNREKERLNLFPSGTWKMQWDGVEETLSDLRWCEDTLQVSDPHPFLKEEGIPSGPCHSVLIQDQLQHLPREPVKNAES